MTGSLVVTLSRDVGVVVEVFGSGSSAVFHFSVVLLLKGCVRAFGLYHFVYQEPFRVMIRKWETEAKDLKAEDEKVMDEIDRERAEFDRMRESKR